MKVLVLTLGIIAAGTVTAQAGNLVKNPSQCSNAGDQTARPVYKNGKLKGYYCAQDNRGSGGGGIR